MPHIKGESLASWNPGRSSSFPTCWARYGCEAPSCSGHRWPAPWGFSIDLSSEFDTLVRVGGLGPRLAEALPPGAIRTPFHIVTEGTCWLKAATRSRPIQLEAGDFVIFPRCRSHSMLDAPLTRSVSLVDLLRSQAGLLRREAAAHVGRLYLADISVPRQVYSRMGISPGNIFRTSDIVPVGPL